MIIKFIQEDREPLDDYLELVNTIGLTITDIFAVRSKKVKIVSEPNIRNITNISFHVSNSAHHKKEWEDVPAQEIRDIRAKMRIQEIKNRKKNKTR